MTDQPVDPFDDRETSAPKAFAVGYKRTNGPVIVYGGLLFGLVLLVLGIAGDFHLAAALALVPLLVAFWHYPLIDTRDPQLGANADGLFIERLGFVRWATIRQMQITRTYIRSIELVTLELSLTCPVDEAVDKKHQFPFWKVFMARNWQSVSEKSGPEKLTVRLDTLNGNPEHILKRAQAFRPI